MMTLISFINIFLTDSAKKGLSDTPELKYLAGSVLFR